MDDSVLWTPYLFLIMLDLHYKSSEPELLVYSYVLLQRRNLHWVKLINLERDLFSSTFWVRFTLPCIGIVFEEEKWSNFPFIET